MSTKKPKNRRPRGEGSFYERADGMHIGAVWYEDKDGQPRRVTVSSRDKVKAMEKFRKLQADITSGTFMPSTKMTVGDWFEYWVEKIVKPNRAPNTYNSYRFTIDNQILPFVGTKKLPVTPAVIRTNLARVGERWSARTAELTYSVWSVAMKAAKAEEVIRTNPVEAVAKPVNNASTGKAHTAEQARRVLLVALENGDRMVTRWAAAYLLGARQGELLGLERDRIDLTHLTVDLSWKLQILSIKEGASLEDADRFVAPKGLEVRPLFRKFALTRPKTKSSKRLTPIPAPLAAILDVYLKATPANKYGLTWVTPTGKPIPAKTDNEAWHAALAAAGVPDARLHDARHTTATLLMEMGVEEAIRMQIMGQSTVASQRIYAHADLGLQRKALGNLDRLLEID